MIMIDCGERWDGTEIPKSTTVLIALMPKVWSSIGKEGTLGWECGVCSFHFFLLLYCLPLKYLYPYSYQARVVFGVYVWGGGWTRKVVG